jgi:hypothetical protein
MEAEESFSKMLVDCFLPAEHDITPAWMSDDYSVSDNQISRPRAMEFEEFEIRERRVATTHSGEPNNASSTSTATSINIDLGSTSGSELTPELTHPVKIGNYFNPEGEDEHSLLLNPVVMKTIDRLSAETSPDLTLEKGRLTNPNILGLKKERHAEVFSAFSKIDLPDLMTVLSNTVLTDKFKLELSQGQYRPLDSQAESHVQSNIFRPHCQEDKLIAQTKLKLHPNTSSALNLQMHIVHTLTRQINEHHSSDPDQRNLALDLRNQIKANSSIALNGRFVKILTEPNGIEKIKFKLNKALIGYTARPTE